MGRDNRRYAELPSEPTTLTVGIIKLSHQVDIYFDVIYSCNSHSLTRWLNIKSTLQEDIPCTFLYDVNFQWIFEFGMFNISQMRVIKFIGNEDVKGMKGGKSHVVLSDNSVHLPFLPKSILAFLEEE